MSVIVAPKKQGGGFLGSLLGLGAVAAPFIPGMQAAAPFLGAGAALANGNPIGAAQAAAPAIFGGQSAPAPQADNSAAWGNFANDISRQNEIGQGYSNPAMESLMMRQWMSGGRG
jgi:hypothetical protein